MFYYVHSIKLILKIHLIKMFLAKYSTVCKYLCVRTNVLVCVLTSITNRL